MRCKSYRKWGEALDRNLKIESLSQLQAILDKSLAVQESKRAIKQYIIDYEKNTLTEVKEPNGST